MTFDRRDLIAAFLGAAVAQAGCRRPAVAPRRVPGQLVDRAVQTGHLLRAAPPAAAGEAPSVEALIVGGGVAGLSAAWRLRSAGVHDLLLVELESELGGTSRAGRNGVSAHPWGAHYLPAPLHDTGPVARLLREMGVLTGVEADGTPRYAEEALIHEPEERLFYRGSWYEGLYLRAGASAEDLAQLGRFEAMTRALSAQRDDRGRKVFDVPVDASSDDPAFTTLDGISMAQWMGAQGFTSQRLLWSVDYACRDDFGAPAALISAWAGLWYFCARSDGAKQNAGYLSWPEGNGRLVAQLGRGLLPSQRRCDVLVHTLVPVDGGWLAHAVRAGSHEPFAVRARQVIFAGPRFVAARVVAPWRKSPPPFLSAFQYGAWVVANLTVSAPPASDGYPLSWDNVFYDSRSLGYVVATHQREIAVRTGPTVLTWYYPLEGADVRAERERLLSAGYEDWEAVVMTDLRAAHPDIDAKAERLEVMRWGHAMVRPVPGFIWSGARREASQSLGGSLHFAHSDLGGLAVFEEANWQGVRAAERAAWALGRRSPSWL